VHISASIETEKGPRGKLCVSRNQWRPSDLVVFFYLCSGTTWSLGTEVKEGGVQGGPIKTEPLLVCQQTELKGVPGSPRLVFCQISNIARNIAQKYSI